MNVGNGHHHVGVDRVIFIVLNGGIPPFRKSASVAIV